MTTMQKFHAHWPTLALLAAGVLHTLVLGTLPLFVAGMVAELNLGEREVGWLASADMAGSALAAVCIIAFVRRVPWRPIACVAIALVIAGNLTATRATGFETLMLTRVVAGIGGGLILSIVFVGLCRSTSPDRYFGLYTFSQLGLQALFLSFVPSILKAYGVDVLYLLFAAISAGCLVFVLSFPKSAPSASGADAPIANAGGSRLSPSAIIALAAQGIYFLAPAAAWAYFERIGQTFGLTLDAIGPALGAAAVVGITGAASVVVLGTRISRMTSMVLGTALSIATVALLMGGSGFAAFLVAAALFNFAWNFTFPYQMGTLATLDDSEAVPILSLLVQLMGLALGPLAASFLNPQGGYQTILIACMGCYVASLVLFRVAERKRASVSEPVEFSKHVQEVGTFSLRPLRIPQDIPLVHDWVTREYAKYWGMQNKSVQEVEAMYREIVRPGHVRAFLGLYDGTPSFLAECYRPSEDVLAAYYEASQRDRGMHILIAPMQKRIPRFTWHAFTTVLDYLFSDRSVQRVVVEPDIRNEKVHVLNRRAGFVVEKTIELPASPAQPAKVALLSICTREAYAAASSGGNDG